MGLKLKIHLFKSILKAFLPNFDVFSIGRVILNSQVDKLFLNLINDVLAIVFKLLLEFLVVEFCHYVNKTKTYSQQALRSLFCLQIATRFANSGLPLALSRVCSESLACFQVKCSRSCKAQGFRLLLLSLHLSSCL